MMHRRNADCPSDLRLDQWLSGELGGQAGELERHVPSCEHCQRRVAELRQAQRSFQQEAPAFAELRARSKAQPAARFRALVPALLAAAVLALAIGQPWQRAGDGDGTRAKGHSASLSWVVRRGERVFVAAPGEPLRAGDALQFSVSTRESVHVALLGLDATGHASVYYPDVAQLPRLPAGNAQPLGLALELDATPGEERLFAFFCSSAVPLARLREAVERAPAAPAVPQGCALQRVVLQKEVP